jgi:hypothetical protein
MKANVMPPKITKCNSLALFAGLEKSQAFFIRMARIQERVRTQPPSNGRL